MMENRPARTREAHPPRPYILAETTWKSVREQSYEVAVLPWGATEAHNYHLPYGTDCYETEHVAAEAARRAWDAGAKVVVLPVIPFGVQTGQLDIPLCVNLNPSTQLAVLADVAHSLDEVGVPKLVVLNGHGGNDFRQMIRELQPQVGVFLSLVDWYRVVDPAGHFEDVGDHAGEMETSVMLHLRPDLVLPLEEAGDGAQQRPRIRALREGWAWAPRQWTKVTRDTGVGDPRQSSSEKGDRYLEEVIDRIAGFFSELAATDPANLYGDPEASG